MSHRLVFDLNLGIHENTIFVIIRKCASISAVASSTFNGSSDDLKQIFSSHIQSLGIGSSSNRRERSIGAVSFIGKTLKYLPANNGSAQPQLAYLAVFSFKLPFKLVEGIIQHFKCIPLV
ncbi:hypothetical protein ACMFMG_003095 [Clarireedia jacksonii]